MNKEEKEYKKYAETRNKLYKLHTPVPGKRTDLQPEGVKVDVYKEIA